VGLSPSGRDALTAATGCADPTATRFFAADGSWRVPTLAVEGPGCRFAARWTPRTEEATVPPVS